MVTSKTIALKIHRFLNETFAMQYQKRKNSLETC